MAVRFPQFRLDGDEAAYYEPGAGFVRPERCVEAQLSVAERLGAEVRRDERVLALDATARVVRVRTDRGVCEAPRVVLAVGAWVQDFVEPRDRALFSVYRQVLGWYALQPGTLDHSPGTMPVFIWGLNDGSAFYGFPAVDGADNLKVAAEQFDCTTTAGDARSGFVRMRRSLCTRT